jgi:hypothetical protein
MCNAAVLVRINIKENIRACRMQKNISATMFYSLLFAMGGAPTIAMLIIRAQTSNPEIIYNALVGLSVIIACILVPVILIQNAILFAKRKSESLELKIQPLSQFYLVLNVLCLIYWLGIQFIT